MSFIERVLRVMTHLNIGCALGMVAWLVWSGLQVVGGQWVVPRQPPASGEVRPASLGAAPFDGSCCLHPIAPASPAPVLEAGPVPPTHLAAVATQVQP